MHLFSDTTKMPRPQEEIYIGMTKAKTLPIYDANKVMIDKAVVKQINAMDCRLGNKLNSFIRFPVLEELDLQSNELTDDLLMKLSVSESLKSLNLAHNDLNEVPLMPKQGLKNLTRLILKGNKNLDIDTCISYLCGFRFLTYLDLSDADIKSLPVELRKLQSLEYLDISGNPDLQEDKFPQVICSLKNLKELHVDKRGKKTELVRTVLQEFLRRQVKKFCPLQPSEKGVLTWSFNRGMALEFFKEVMDMEEEGSWPESGREIQQLHLNSSMLGDMKETDMDFLQYYFENIQSLQKISLLSLCTNNFTHVPQISNFKHIQQLGLCRNNFKDIPSQVRQLPKLTHLYFTENQVYDLQFTEDDFKQLVLLDLLGNPLCRRFQSAKKCYESRFNLAAHHSGKKVEIKGLERVLEEGTDILNESEEEEEDTDKVGDDKPKEKIDDDNDAEKEVSYSEICLDSMVKPPIEPCH